MLVERMTALQLSGNCAMECVIESVVMDALQNGTIMPVHVQESCEAQLCDSVREWYSRAE